MMHLLVRAEKDDYAKAARALAADRAIWISPGTSPTADPAVQQIELSVGDGTLEFELAEVAQIFAQLSAT